MKEGINFYSYNESIVISNKNEFKPYKSKQTQFENYTSINIPYNIFYTLSKLLGLTINLDLYNHKQKDNLIFLFMQNNKQEKLVINCKEKEYMIKKFKCIKNEVDYIKIPNDIFNILIEALKENDYKQIDFNDSYYATSSIIYENIEEFIQTKKYKDYYMFERDNHFNIKQLKSMFMNLYNDKIDKAYFRNYIELLQILIKYHPVSLTKKKQLIYDYLEYLFEDLHFKKNDLVQTFADFNFLYNELNEIQDSNIDVFYQFNHYNSYNDEVYEVVIFDWKNELYWMGFVNNPVFKFNISYKSTYILNILEGKIRYQKYEDKPKRFDTFRIIDEFYDLDYEFDETLKDKAFKSKE